MSPAERRQLALQISDQINADTTLARDIAPWLNPTSVEIFGADKSDKIKELEEKLETAEERIEEAKGVIDMADDGDGYDRVLDALNGL